MQEHAAEADLAACVADIAVVWAKLDDDIRGFVVERGTEGFTTAKIDGKLSLRASVTGDIGLLTRFARNLGKAGLLAIAVVALSMAATPLVVAADHFDLHAKLGFLLGAFAKTIEAKILENLDDMLAQARSTAPARKSPAARKKAAGK